MATNNVVNAFKKLTIEERAEIKEKFADVSTCTRCARRHNIHTQYNYAVVKSNLSVFNISLVCCSYNSLD